jgi:competence protein ComEC
LGVDVWSPSWRDALRSPLSALARSLEAEQERWFLWLPVQFGAGIALYFALPAEPSTSNALLPVAAALALLLAGKRQWPGALLTAGLLALACGVAAAKLRTESMRAPVLQRQIGPVEVTGFVELIEPRPVLGQRLSTLPRSRRWRLSTCRCVCACAPASRTPSSSPAMPCASARP